MSKGKVTVLGVGRLGICLALKLEKAGYDVVGADIFPGYVDALNNKTFNSSEPLVTETLKAAKNIKFTVKLEEALAHSDIIFIMVATPTGSGDKSYDHSHLSKLLCNINKQKVKNKHLIVGCTVLPGYIANTGRFLVKDCENTTVSYNPEFIAQGDVMRGLVNPDMVLIGEANKEIGDILEEMYNQMCENKPMMARMSAESAEICKLSVNCFITTKVAFANMVGDIAANTPGANGQEILKAVGADSRIGHKYLRPGYGFGGPCFPRDNRALGNYAKSVGIEPLIPIATDNSNKNHTKFQAEQEFAKGLEEYVFDDVCYKPNCPVPIIEESQKLEIARQLAARGKKVTVKGREDVITNCKIEFGQLFTYVVE